MHKNHHTTGKVKDGWGSDDLEPHVVDGSSLGPLVLSVWISPMKAPPDYISHGRFKTPGVLGPSDPTAPGCHDGYADWPAWDGKQSYVQIEVVLPSDPAQHEVWLVPSDEYWRRPDGAAERRFPWEIEGSFVIEAPEHGAGVPQPFPSGQQHGGFDFTAPYQVCPPAAQGELVFFPSLVLGPGEVHADGSSFGPGCPVPERPIFEIVFPPPINFPGDGNLLL